MVLVLLEAQGVEVAQQRLGQFAERQHRQAGADLLLQGLNLGQYLCRHHTVVVLGGDP
ncbi:hypothetical protein D3C85_1718640 [compost metagenome]